MKSQINILALACILIFDFNNNVYSGVINATSCNSDDVQAAVNNANDGDTVSIPAGNCNWNTTVNISDKAITLKGAGIDNTIITDNTGENWDQTLLWIVGADEKFFRITDLTISNNNGPSAIQIRGNANKWRIDHIKFDEHQTLAISIGYCDNPETYGVIDSCIFTANSTAAGIAIHSNGDAWSDSLRLGTANAIYVESCTFDYVTFSEGKPACDAYEGAKYVFRYNTLKNQQLGHHDACSGCPPLPRAAFSFEIYNNSITMTDYAVFGIRMRGGTGVVFNNSIAGTVQQVLSLTNYRSCTDGISCLDYDRCDGNSSYDGNLDPTGYPCLDQIGRTSDLNMDGIQDQEPLYEWDNTYNDADIDFYVQDLGCTNPSVSDHIKENRDYYNDQLKPGYAPYTYPHPLANDNNNGTSTLITNKAWTKEIFKVYPNYIASFDPIYVEYQINNPENIEISLFSVLGVKIKTFYKGTQNTGKYKLELNDIDLSPGIYFVTFIKRDFKTVKRIIKI